MELTSHADANGLFLLGEHAYWLTLLPLIVLGLALVVYEEACKKSGDGCDTKDEVQGRSPAAHIEECIDSLDEALDGVCNGEKVASAAAQGTAAARPGRAGSQSPAARCWALFSERDHALGESVYLVTRGSSILRHLATVVTMSCDEAIWFSAPPLMVVGQLLTRIGPQGTIGFAVELLNDVMMVCVIEMGMKFCVQRERPRYAKQSTFYILPGEWWSFPSGHSMRAAYLAHRFSVTPSLQAAILGPAMAGSAAIPALAYAWAAMVGLSRVAKGRHSPFDVLVGLAAGVPLAELTLFVGLEAWTVGRFFAGSVECVLLGIMAAQPELRLEGFYVHAGLQALWFSFQPYNVWLPLTWGAVLALSSALFCFSYAAAYVTSSRRPWLL